MQSVIVQHPDKRGNIMIPLNHPELCIRKKNIHFRMRMDDGLLYTQKRARPWKPSGALFVILPILKATIIIRYLLLLHHHHSSTDVEASILSSDLFPSINGGGLSSSHCKCNNVKFSGIISECSPRFAILHSHRLLLYSIIRLTEQLTTPTKHHR